MQTHAKHKQAVFALPWLAANTCRQNLSQGFSSSRIVSSICGSYSTLHCVHASNTFKAMAAYNCALLQ
jgi:hypothetical protein